MQPTLYHYVHCPYCIRVRMALGYLGLSYHSQVLPYDDEATPIKLTGKKMLPIIEIDGKIMNESLDIISVVDKNKKIINENITKTQEFEQFDLLLNQIGPLIHSLAMPYWIYTPEFSDSARKYFQKKKEEKRGPFNELIKNQASFFRSLEIKLLEIEKNLEPFYKSNQFGIYDIMLAAHLWGLYTVSEFQFSPLIHTYLQNIKKICHFNYHEDFWR